MQWESTPKIAGRASASGAMSRRAFFAGAGAIATVPASAVAQPLYSPESQLDDCLTRLKDVLGELYPETTVLSGLNPTFDGASFSLVIFGLLDCVDWTGNGFYEVRTDDETAGGVYYVKQIIGRWENKPLLSGARMVDGLLGPFVFIRPELLRRKLEGGAA